MKRQHYTANALKTKVGTHFDTYEHDTMCYATSDGYLFRSENRAYLHAQASGLSVYAYSKGDSTPDVESETSVDYLSANAAIVIAGIKSLQRSVANGYIASEQSGKNRKSVIKALEDYVGKSPSAIAIAAVVAPKVGETVNLALTITPATDQVDTSVYFVSSDEQKATVDDEGVVTMLAEGAVTIKAIAYSGFVEGTVTFTIEAAA
ncbi:MAG: Ig-like domain-containing protein [Chitinophagales bacterium]|nr:Ig-like domain-containing protein [Chitinophagales bacterium]